MSSPLLFTATVLKKYPKGYIHLPLGWWTRPCKQFVSSPNWSRFKGERMHLYTTGPGHPPVWVANNHWLYQVILNYTGDNRNIVLPHVDHETRVWMYNGEPVLLEKVSRMQLCMQHLWTR